mmetsp:Transcript_79854/g.156174  ORF Transcript_79854/g.156174 Transcript_79854/m.156174 type:complete len:404 (-) Transcript_79854:331-1542(-)
MAALTRLGVDNFILVSLDLPTHEALVAIGAPSFFFETHYTDVVVGVGAASASRAYRAPLLNYKWKLVVAVLKRGVSVLLADLDTVFLRDFRPLLGQSQSHIIAARGISKGLIIRMPLLLLRSCVEVLHLMPRLIAAIAHWRDDEVALNKILSGVVAWAEPPLRPSTFDRFVEGKTFRSILSAPSSGISSAPFAPSSQTLGTGGGSALDPTLRLTLVPNRLYRLYECTRGHPAETAIAMHCNNEVTDLSSEADLHFGAGLQSSLVMTRAGKLKDQSKPAQKVLSAPNSDLDSGEFTRLRLNELGLWMLHHKWRQQFDLIQTRINRNTAKIGDGPRGLEWSDCKQWLLDNTAWRYPSEAESKRGVESGTGQNHIITGHNLKHNCRYTSRSAYSSASSTAPAIICT